MFAAKRSLASIGLASIDTGGLTGTLDYSKPGVSPGRQHFILQPAAGEPGALRTVRTLEEGPTVAAFTG